MKPMMIPIRSAEAQAEEPFEFLPMPHDMATFSMPEVPEPGPDADVAGARDVLQFFIDRLAQWLQGGGTVPALELRGLPAQTLRVLNETLGQGEVAAIVTGHELRVQETVFAGVWRQQHFDHDGALLHDLLVAAPVPPVLLQLARETSSLQLPGLPLPEGAMNVPAMVAELAEAMQRCGPGAPAHVINLTLLPLSPPDVAHLDALLGAPRVVILSRGFGNCRISSTAARHVWRVQYFNNMETLILNTLEVTELPEVAVAAREDLLDSHERLADLVQWMSETLADA